MKTTHLLLLGLLLISAITLSQTVYVNSSTGNDVSGDGSALNPYKTFHKGYTMVSSGGTIDLTGTFDWTNADETGDAIITGYVINKNLTMQGQGAGTTYIQAAVTSNTADRRIFTFYSNVTVIGLTLRNGKNISATHGAGGIYIHDYLTTNIQECIIEDNYFEDTGYNYWVAGGIQIGDYNGGTVNIDRTTFKNNNCLANAYGAGALMVTQSTALTITNSTFEGNTGTDGNSTDEGYSKIAGCLNVFRFANVKIANCTFKGNISNTCGGALIMYNNTVYLTNNTFVDNQVTLATGNGGAIWLENNSNVFFKNNIIANNLKGGVGNDVRRKSGTTTMNGYNIVEYTDNVTFNGTGDITGDQVNLFGTGISSTPVLGDNGTLFGTQTIALSSGSVAIDAGSSSANGSVSIPTTDQRGINRDATPDIGSFELAVTSQDFTWTGTSGTDWNTSGNWDLNAVPTAIDNVTIPSVSNDPNIDWNGAAECNNLTIESGAILSVESGGLITNGTVTNNGSFTIDVNLGTGLWELMGTPVSGLTANTFMGDYLQTYTEATDTWNEVTEPTTPLIPGMGYALWMNSKVAFYTFTGTPNTGDFSTAYTYTPVGNPLHYSFNLMGNPYPSYIDWDVMNETYGAVYHYDGSAYSSWNGSGAGSQYIDPGKGFLIAPGATGTLDLTNDCRAIMDISKGAEVDNSIIVLEAGNNSFLDELYIIFNDDATETFDLPYDAWKLLSDEVGISQVYSYMGNKMLSIDTRPECEAIQLGFLNTVSGIYSIGVKDIAGISEAILEDTKKGTFHNLQSGAYEFAWEVTNDDKRFILHLSPTAVYENPGVNKVGVYSSGKTVYVRNTDQLINLELTIYNIMGQAVQTESLATEKLNAISTDLENGIYIVSVRTGKEVLTDKVFIK